VECDLDLLGEQLLNFRSSSEDLAFSFNNSDFVFFEFIFCTNKYDLRWAYQWRNDFEVFCSSISQENETVRVLHCHVPLAIGTWLLQAAHVRVWLKITPNYWGPHKKVRPSNILSQHTQKGSDIAITLEALALEALSV